MATTVRHPHFLPIAERPAPRDMTTPQLVREFAAGMRDTKTAEEHDRHGDVVHELRLRRVLD